MFEADPLQPLVAAAREGDDRALAVLVQQTQSSVWRLCAALGSADDAADLTQETYLRALRALPQYRAEAPVLPWLLSIARRVCADQIRREQRQRRLIDRITVLRAAGRSTDAPDSGLIELLVALEHDRREAFVLTQQLGLSYEEAAQVVGCPIGTIRSRVARARADLLEAVQRSETA